MRLVLLGCFVLSACHHAGSVDDSEYDLSAISPLVDLGTTDGAMDDASAVPDFGGRDVTCDPATPFDGGDPTGSWTLAGGCATGEAFFPLTCAGIVYSGVTVTGSSGSGSASGTIHLRANTGYDRVTHARVSGVASVPASCLITPNECAQFGKDAAAQFDWLTITCASTTAACLCDVAYSIDLSESGTWRVEGNGFSLAPQSGLGPYHFSAGIDDGILRYEGDSMTDRGDRGITWVGY